MTAQQPRESRPVTDAADQAEQLLEAALRRMEPELVRRALALVPAIIADYGDNADPSLRAAYGDEVTQQIHIGLALWLGRRGYKPDEMTYVLDVAIRRAGQRVDLDSVQGSISLISRVFHRALLEAALSLPQTPELRAVVADRENDIQRVESLWFGVMKKGLGQGMATRNITTVQALFARVFSGRSTSEADDADLLKRGWPLKVNLNGPHGMILIADFGAPLPDDAVGQVVEGIQALLDRSFCYSGCDGAMKYAALIVPVEDEPAWLDVREKAHSVAVRVRVRIVATDVVTGVPFLREAHGEALTLGQRFVHQLYPRPGLVRIRSLRVYAVQTSVPPEPRRRFTNATFGPFMKQPLAERVDLIRAARTFHEHDGDQEMAARALGYSRKTLQRKLGALKERTGHEPQTGELLLAAVFHALEYEVVWTGPAPDRRDGSLASGSWVVGQTMQAGVEVDPAEVARMAFSERWLATAAPRRYANVAPSPRPSSNGPVSWMARRIVALTRRLAERLGLPRSSLCVIPGIPTIKRFVRDPAWVQGWRGRSRVSECAQMLIREQIGTSLALATVLALGVGATAPMPGVLAASLSPPRTMDTPPIASNPGGGPSGAPPPADRGVSRAGNSSHPAIPRGLPALIPGSGSETPQDSRVYAAAPSPNYPRDHTVLALGVGHTCSCPVLLRSTDGGASWESAIGPPQGAQIVLPPDWPRDPRIFVGNDAGAASPDYVSSGFGAVFTPLSVPPGRLAIAPDFDAGSPQVFVSAQGGVWSYHVDTMVLQALVVDGSASDPPAIAAPPAGSDHELFVVASSLAVPVGPPSAPGGGPPIANTDPVAVACVASGSCSTASRPKFGGVAELAVSPSYLHDHLIAAYRAGTLMLSTDAGRDFEPVELPDGPHSLASVALASSDESGPTVWALTTGPGVAPQVIKQRVGGSAWVGTAPLSDRPIPGGGELVVLSDRRVMVFLAAGGLACTATGGLNWAPTCPADHEGG
ncbi:MAG: hypothetical protein ACYDGR_07700 [Candidatus Dormibacteria bacterium]